MKKRYFKAEQPKITATLSQQPPLFVDVPPEEVAFPEESVDEPSSLPEDDGFDLFRSQFTAIVGDADTRAVRHLHRKYFNQPNYLMLATDEFYLGILYEDNKRNHEEIGEVNELYDRMSELVLQEQACRPAWSRFLGNMTVEAMATRPTMRPLKYLQRLQVKHMEAKKQLIVRIFTDEERPRELGRLPQDVTNMMAPLLDLGIAEFDVLVMVETSRRLSVGDSFYLSIDCFLKSTAFINESVPDPVKDVKRQKKDLTKIGFNFASETDEERVLKQRQYAIMKLFERLGLRLAEAEQVEVTQDGDALNLDQLKQFYSENQQSEYLQSLPETTTPPPENFKLDLREYQRHGLSWMLVREKEFSTLERLSLSQSLSTQAQNSIKQNEKGVMNPLWKEYRWPKDTSYRAQQLGTTEEDSAPFYGNLHNGELSIETPLLKTLVRGGILADEMGLGKTISTLALVNSVPYDTETAKGYANKTTLVVVPMSLLSQWKSEFDKANNNPNHQCMIYYGDLVEVDLRPVLCNKDKNIPIVILTTYGTIQNEYQRLNKFRDALGHLPKVGIYSVTFFRIVIDEGHTIRNRSTKTAKAIHELQLARKWILTGTPVVNRLDDIYSLVKFLQLEPWSNISYWKTFVTLPFEQKKFSETLDVVKSVLEPIFLRRTKNMKQKNGEPLVTLPEKQVIIEPIKFNAREEKLYEFFKSRAAQSFKEGLKSGDLLKKYTQILTHILRLRQICCHPDLVGTRSELEEIEAMDKEPALEEIDTSSPDDAEKFPTDTEMRRVMYGLYPKVDLTGSECLICTQAPIAREEMMLTECGHAYCFNCILEHIEFQRNQNKDPFCPACRGSISRFRLFKLRSKETSNKRIRFHTKKDEADPSGLYPFNLYNYDPEKSLSKIEALLRHLKLLKDQNPGDQVVVFSQFSSYLDLIENELSLHPDFVVYKFDGRLNMAEREKLLVAFNKHAEEPPKDRVVVLLLSLKAGGVGLNLTSANRAFMMDPWWSPSVEDQAIDRIHRIGQTSNVTVTRFIIENTIESKMLKIQERKRKMGEAVEVEEEERRKRRIEEIQLLFEE